MLLNFRLGPTLLFLALLFTGAVIDRLEAQPRRPRPADTASQTALIDTLTIQRAAERAATEAAWSARYGDALRRIEQTVQQRRAEARRRARAEAAQLRAEGRVGELESKLLAADRKYAEAIAERQSLVEELGRQSRAFEAETAAYRSLMTRFVADASPEKLEALARYAAGDRREAFPLIQQLTEVENEARTLAAAKLAAEAAETARQQNADNQRAVGVFAIDMMGRGEATAEQVLEAWEKVLRYDDRQRLDRMVLARLWEWSGDDVKAAGARADAARLDNSPGLAERHPIASMISSLDFLHAGGTLRAMADIARSQPTHGAPGVELPPLEIPLQPHIAPFLDTLADCQEAIQAQLEWTAARERDQQLRSIGLGDGAAAALPPKPAVDCSATASAAAAVMGNMEISPQTREALISSLLGIADALVAIGDVEASVPIAEAAQGFCRAWRPTGDPQAILRSQCAFGSVMSGLRLSQSEEFETGAAKARQGIKMVEGLRIEDFPKRQQASVLALIHAAAAQALLNAGKMEEAQAEARKAFAIIDPLLNSTSNFAVSEISRITLRTMIAGMNGVTSPNEAAAAFREAERSVMAFVLAHPNSGLGCRELFKYVEQTTTWIVDSNKEGGIELLDRLGPPLQRCEALTMRLYPDQFPQAVGDLLGIVHYVKVTLGAVKAERVDEAAKGVERVMEAADKVKPSPLIARIQTAVLGELASLQAKRSDPAVALRTARRLEQLARRHDHPDMTILAATTQATAYAALGDAAAVRNQWVEKHKLCSLLPDGVPADDPFADEMVEALATCEAAEETETRAVRSHFETRVAELERGGAPELAETVFYLAAALERARDMEGSKTAYRRAIALKTQSAPARAPSLDPTAFAMARLGGLERDRESLSKVRAWLERERGRRPLAAEEERLLAYAKWTAVRETQ